MAFTQTLQVTHTDHNGGTQTDSFTETGTAYLDLSETVADSETDFEIACAIDVSELAMLYIVSDQDVLLETNNGAGGDDSLSLKANEPVVWHTDSVYANPIITADVTSIFITNASGSAATVRVRALTDATP